MGLATFLGIAPSAARRDEIDRLRGEIKQSAQVIDSGSRVLAERSSRLAMMAGVLAIRRGEDEADHD